MVESKVSQNKISHSKIHSCSLTDSLSSTLWLSNSRFFYSVWHDPFLYCKVLDDGSKEPYSFPCENFYTSLINDEKEKMYLSDSICQHIDLFDFQKQKIIANVFQKENLAKTLTTKLIIKDNILIGITKDPSYFLIDLKTHQTIKSEKFPFRILCVDYNENYEILSLGVKYKKQYSHVEIRIKKLLDLSKSIMSELEKKIESQISDDDNFCPKEHIYSISMSKSCKYKALGVKGKIHLYKYNKHTDFWELETLFQAHFKDDPSLENFTEFNIYKVNFSPIFESFLVSVGGDGLMQFYNVEKKLNSKKVLKSSKTNESNVFLNVGWNPQGSWMHYSKGYQWKAVENNDDQQMKKNSNKLYFTLTEDLINIPGINEILN